MITIITALVITCCSWCIQFACVWVLTFLRDKIITYSYWCGYMFCSIKLLTTSFLLWHHFQLRLRHCYWLTQWYQTVSEIFQLLDLNNFTIIQVDCKWFRIPNLQCFKICLILLLLAFISWTWTELFGIQNSTMKYSNMPWLHTQMSVN